MNKNYRSTAYVIHIRKYRNTSALIDCFTQDQGMIRLVANGVYGSRKTQLHWKGLLRPLLPLCLSWRGESSLKTLVDVEAVDHVMAVPRQKFLFCGFYINELVQRSLIGQEPDARLFQAYHQCVQALISEQDMQLSLRSFEIALLQSLGYAIDFSYDVLGRLVDAKTYYSFDPQVGFLALENRQQHAILGRHLLAISAGEWFDADVKLAAKRILKAALCIHIGDQPLQSRRLFSQL